MIRASGLEPMDNKNKKGDIEIKICGIRPGEKIKEELIINGFTDKTIHPLINIAREDINLPKDFLKNINQVIYLLENNEEEKAVAIFDDLFKKISNNY